MSFIVLHEAEIGTFDAYPGEVDDGRFDIKRAVQKRYKVVLEETWFAEKPEVRKPDARWYMQIPTYCGGFIGLYQESPTIELQWFTPSKRKTARKIINAFPDKGLRMDRHFDGHEAVLYFPPELLMEVCELAGVRKRRTLSPEVREKVMKNLISGKEGAAVLRGLLEKRRVQAESMRQENRYGAQKG